MALAVSLWFDTELEVRLRAVWQRLRDAGIDSPLYDGRYRPHVTLGIWESARSQAFEDRVASLGRTTLRFDIHFAAIGMFPDAGALFLQPVVTPALLDLHHRTHASARDLGVPATPYYEPGAWMPHATVAAMLTHAQLLRACAALLGEPLPLAGEVAALGVVDTPAEVELRRCDLGTRSDGRRSHLPWFDRLPPLG